ncbi:MAG TPA: DMT family transporter [Ignavibacteria bacterium]|nr:DMT family transporter [Ignavibacteria bacterium]HMR39775.1 DMT family transporter [Ignavibacteria bacterium]
MSNTILLYRKFIKSGRGEPWFLLLLLSLIWGSSFILIKEGLIAFTPEQATALRVSIAFVFMLPFVFKNFKKLPKEKRKYIIVIGIVGNLLPSLFFSLAETELESSITGMLNGLTPLFALLIAVYIFKYKIEFYQIVGIIIGFAGTIILSLVNTTGSFGGVNIYALLVVTATLCYAISLNLIAVHLSETGAVTVSALALATIGPVSMIYLFSTDFISVFMTNPDALRSFGAMVILGILGTAVGIVLYTRLIQTTSVFFAGIVTYMIPIVAVFWGLIYGEKIFALHFAGLLLILTGVYYVNKSEDKIIK